MNVTEKKYRDDGLMMLVRLDPEALMRAPFKYHSILRPPLPDSDPWRIEHLFTARFMRKGATSVEIKEDPTVTQLMRRIQKNQWFFFSDIHHELRITELETYDFFTLNLDRGPKFSGTLPLHISKAVLSLKNFRRDLLFMCIQQLYPQMELVKTISFEQDHQKASTDEQNKFKLLAQPFKNKPAVLYRNCFHSLTGDANLRSLIIVLLLDEEFLTDTVKRNRFISEVLMPFYLENQKKEVFDFIRNTTHTY